MAACGMTSLLCVVVFTAEQYHDHQEQLALMKREQLEQVQQQHRVNARTPVSVGAQ